MAYVFHLLHLVTYVYIWGRISYFENIQHWKCVLMLISLQPGSVPDLFSPVCLIGKLCTQLVDKVSKIKYHVCKKHIAIL